MTARKTRPQLNVSSLGVFKVLSALARSDQALGVLELARSLHIPASTAHRALATLERGDFVTQDEGSSKYQLGNAARRTVSAFLNMFPIRRRSIVPLRRLSLLTGHTASLWVRVGRRMVRIAEIEGGHAIVDRRSIGQSLPIGKCVPSLALIVANGEAPKIAGLDELRKRFQTTGFVWSDRVNPNDYAAPLRLHETAFAAIALEGIPQSVFRSHRVEARKIIRSLELDLASNPDATFDPFAHLADADENP